MSNTTGLSQCSLWVATNERPTSQSCGVRLLFLQHLLPLKRWVWQQGRSSLAFPQLAIKFYLWFRHIKRFTDCLCNPIQLLQVHRAGNIRNRRILGMRCRAKVHVGSIITFFGGKNQNKLKILQQFQEVGLTCPEWGGSRCVWQLWPFLELNWFLMVSFLKSESTSREWERERYFFFDF